MQQLIVDQITSHYKKTIGVRQTSIITWFNLHVYNKAKVYTRVKEPDHATADSTPDHTIV